MTLSDRIKEDLKSAMRRRDTVLMGALRMLLSSLQQKEKDKHLLFAQEGKTDSADLTDEEVQLVVASEAKKRREAIEGFEKGGAQDRAQQEKTELACLVCYLPEQMSEDEIRAIVKEAVEKTGVTSMKEIGKLMAELMPRVKGRADGSVVNNIVREILSA
ncbi:MAG: GatB/YqeY domain-containing protein [bacterium]|nr:GatB/YqeY domain-containing protein [bacterium]